MNRLKVLRNEAGITQLRLSQEMDITILTVKNLEKGYNTTVYLALKIAEYFGVKVEDIWPDYTKIIFYATN